jgi:hypothetical protein
LKSWGVDFGAAKCIYFEGHERPDVVVERELFVDYFLSRKENYYLYDPVDKGWIEPIEKPCVHFMTSQHFVVENNFQNDDILRVKNHSLVKEEEKA